MPTARPGLFVAALALLLFIHMDILVWWTLLMVLLVPSFVNWLVKSCRKKIT